MDVHSSSNGVFVDANTKIELTGKGPGEGWGIAIERVHHGSMYVRAVACREGHLWKDINEIRSFPIPAPYVVSLLQWAANTLISLPQDKVRCGNLGVDRLHIFASHTGTLRVSARDPEAEDQLTSAQDLSGGRSALRAARRRTRHRALPSGARQPRSSEAPARC